jgi:hypothetical protein
MDLTLKTRAIHKLRPNTEWSLDENESLIFKDESIVVPTEAEIHTASEQVKADEITQAATKATQRQALLTRLGITEDEARLLLG